MPSHKPRIILAGAGAHGMATYAKRVLPKLVAEERIEVTAIIEPYADRRREALDHLELPSDRGFAETVPALAAAPCDALIVASPYIHHREASLHAVQHGAHLFIEKPVADNLANCCVIEAAVREAGLKAAVNMSARFECEKRAFDQALKRGAAGEVEYLFMRLAWDHSKAARHRAALPHPYLMEGGVHALDMLRGFAGGKPRRVYNMTWKSPHSVYQGNASNLVSFEMDNGVCCALEGSWTVRAPISTWRDEYIRADGSAGALLLDHRKLAHYVKSQDPGRKLDETVMEYTNKHPGADGTEFLFRAFVDWITGAAESHPTELADNLQCMALLFAAIDSAERGQAVNVPEFLEAARAAAE